MSAQGEHMNDAATQPNPGKWREQFNIKRDGFSKVAQIVKSQI